MTDDFVAPWLAEVRKQLGARAEAINEALNDVSEITSSSAAGWPDLRHEPAVTVYIVSGAVLHILRGERDSEPDQEKLNGDATSQCDCQVVPITAASSWSLSVTRTARAVRPTRVRRQWAFQVGAVEFEFEYPPPDDARSEPDPAPFAHALAVAISARAGDP